MKNVIAAAAAILLAGACAPLPADNQACAARAQSHADRVTRAAASPEYQMDWRGKYEDEYARCAAGK